MASPLALSPALAASGAANGAFGRLRAFPLAHGPGLGLCLAVAGTALALERLEILLFGRAWLETLVLAILVGAAVRAVWAPPGSARAGVAFCGKQLLEAAVALLGASVSAGALAAAGPPLLLGVLAVVALSIPLGYGVGRALGLPRPMALLIACGNSICGNSAIAALAPTVRADPKDVCAAIGFTAALGVAVVLGLPLLSAAAGLSPKAYGVLAGLTVYAVPQVLAATAGASPVAAQLGALVKLVRVLALGPVALVLSLLCRAPGEARRPSVVRLAPWFIQGFLLLLAARSFGLISPAAAGMMTLLAQALTVLAMAALGLGVEAGAVRRAGARAVLAVTLSLLLLLALAFGLLTLLALR
jgi:uncharacterized integral membrane protein (TIGR00698 family)